MREVPDYIKSRCKRVFRLDFRSHSEKESCSLQRATVRSLVEVLSFLCRMEIRCSLHYILEAMAEYNFASVS